MTPFDYRLEMHGEDVPPYAEVRFTVDHLKRIIHLSQVARDADVIGVVDYGSPVAFVYATGEEAEFEVDCCRMNVGTDMVYWNGQMDDGTSAIGNPNWETDCISIEALKILLSLMEGPRSELMKHVASEHDIVKTFVEQELKGEE